MFENLQTDASIKEAADTLGGNGPLESGLVDFVIDLAYMDKSSGGAMNCNLTLKTQDGKTVKITEYVTSGTAKGCKNYYERNGERHYLPGFNTINSIALLAFGKEISALTPETKSVKVYDFKQKKEIPMDKDVLTQLLGKEISIGLLKVIEDSNVKNDSGVYVPSGFTREMNQIDKVFHAKTHLTVAEIKAEAMEASFYEKWGEKNTGITRDKSEAKNGHIPKPRDDGNATPAATADATPTESLFGQS